MGRNQRIGAIGRSRRIGTVGAAAFCLAVLAAGCTSSHKLPHKSASSPHAPSTTAIRSQCPSVAASSTGAPSQSVALHAGVYGPPGAQFSIAFPSAPQTVANPKALTNGGAPGAHYYAYWVTPDGSNPFSGTAKAAPALPTFEVVAVVAPTTAHGGASTYVQTLLEYFCGMRDIHRDGWAGLRVLGPAATVQPVTNGQAKLAYPDATEGVLGVSRGEVAYIVRAITAQPALAKRYLASFHPR